jgi:hypothetical protein
LDAQIRGTLHRVGGIAKSGWRWLTLAVLAAVCTGGGSAHAATTISLGERPPSAGPTWAGDEFLITRADASAHQQVYAVGSAGHARLVGAQSNSVRGLIYITTWLAASAEGYALQYDGGYPDSDAGHLGLEAGLFGQAPRVLPYCPRVDLARPHAALAANQLVYAEGTPGGDCRIQMADLATDAPPRTLAESGVYPKAAGRYVAWLDRITRDPRLDIPRSDLVVYDLDRSAIAYRVRQSQIPGAIRDYDISPDGRALLSYGPVYTRGLYSGPHSYVGWVSASSPRPHRVDLPVARSYRVQIHDRTFVAERIHRDTHRYTLSVIHPGGRERILTRQGVLVSYGAPETFSYDGKRVAWLEHPGRRFVVRIERLPS